MPQICHSFTVWVDTVINDPVEKWVEETREECQQYPWWDPRGWVCWLVVTLVKITEWVARHVLQPITKVICFFVSFVIGGILLPVGVVIDTFCSTCHAFDSIKHLFWNVTKITGGEKVPSATAPGQIDYHFTCNCPDGTEHPIVITIPEDDDKALELAKEACDKEC
jgi:hypothetical protein